jgi:hypothetical protein
MERAPGGQFHICHIQAQAKPAQDEAIKTQESPPRSLITIALIATHIGLIATAWGRSPAYGPVPQVVSISVCQSLKN